MKDAAGNPAAAGAAIAVAPYGKLTSALSVAEHSERSISSESVACFRKSATLRGEVQRHSVRGAASIA
jgi:hypothetical protein